MRVELDIIQVGIDPFDNLPVYRQAYYINGDCRMQMAVVHFEQFKIGLNGIKQTMWTKPYNVVENFEAFATAIKAVVNGPIVATISDLSEHPTGIVGIDPVPEPEPEPEPTPEP
jgi:hypothetical protein